MTIALEKILSYVDNEKVVKFLGIDKIEHHTLTSFDEKDFYTHEGLEDFLKIDVPPCSKYILDNYGIIIKPETGEIIAFQFDRFDTAFKILNPNRYNSNYEHIKKGLVENQKSHKANKVSLGYFSNVYDDGYTIVDISGLGSEWALAIYFVGQTEILVKEFYHQIDNKSQKKQATKTVVLIMIIAVLAIIAYSVIFSPLPIFR